MKIHNKLTILKSGKKYVSYNSLLTPVLTQLSDNIAYNSYLAIGLDGSETVEGQTHLNSYATTLSLVDDSFNYNPLNGTLKVTKKLVLDENNLTPLEIVEVGLTGLTEVNPEVVDRFLVNGGEPIYRDSGEEMTIEVSLFLTLDSDSIVFLTGGTNPLVKFLLGGGLDGMENSWYVAKSTNTTAGQTIILRSIDGETLYPASCDFSISGENLTISISANILTGVVSEVLLVLGESVVARCNVSENFGYSSGNIYTAVASVNKDINIDIPSIVSIDQVYDTVSSKTITGYTKLFYGTSFDKNIVESPFSSESYSATVERFVSRQGTVVAFRNGNSMDVYAFSGTSFSKRDVTEIDFSNAQQIKFFKDYCFIKYFDGLNYWFKSYKYKSVANVFKYYEINFNVEHPSYPGGLKTDCWNNFDISETNLKNYYCFMVCSPRTTFYYTVYESNGAMVFSSVGYSTIYVFDRIISSNPSNVRNYSLIGYKPNQGKVNYSESTNFTTSRNAMLDEIVHGADNDPGSPYACGNICCSPISNDGIVYFFNMKSATTGVAIFNGATKFWMSDRLNYMATRQQDGSIKFYYVDSSFNRYPFMVGLPSGIEQENVVDMLFLDGAVLLFMNNGTNILVQIDQNKTIISNKLTEGNRIEVSYTLDSSPGLDGQDVYCNFLLDVNIGGENGN